jgi:hypothetical protein
VLPPHNSQKQWPQPSKCTANHRITPVGSFCLQSTAHRAPHQQPNYSFLHHIPVVPPLNTSFATMVQYTRKGIRGEQNLNEDILLFIRRRRRRKNEVVSLGQHVKVIWQKKEKKCLLVKKKLCKEQGSVCM